MGELQNSSEQPKETTPAQKTSESWLQARKAQIAKFFKREKAESVQNASSTEPKVDDSGFRKLMGQIGDIDNFESVTFPGHRYMGKDLQSMMEKLYPEIVKKLTLDPDKAKDTGNPLLLKAVLEGDKVSIVKALDDVERDIVAKIGSKTPANDPNRIFLTYSKNIRALLQGQIAKEKAEAQPASDLNPTAKQEIDQVLAQSLEGDKKEE